MEINDLQWISIKDRLPNEFDIVLVTHDGVVEEGMIVGDNWMLQSDYPYDHSKNIVAWCPLRLRDSI